MSNLALGNDWTSGTAPQFVPNTDCQLELSAATAGTLLDLGNVASITAAFKSAASPDAAPVLAVTVTPSSAGWNANPAAAAGDDVVPGYAVYSSGGSYTVGVQAGGVYSWEPGADDYALQNGSGGSYVAGSNLVASLSSPKYTHSGTPYYYTLGTLVSAGSFYQWFAGSAADTGVSKTLGGASQTLVGGFFLATGTDALNGSGSGTTAVGAQVFAAQAGANMVGLTAVAYSAGTPATTGSNLVLSPQYYNSGTNLVPVGAVYTTSGSPYRYTLTGLTTGATYYYTTGSVADTGVSSPALAATGYFVAGGTSVVLLGSGSGAVAVGASVYLVSASAGNFVSPGQFVVSGLTAGNTYYYALGANDSAVGGNVAASGFFTAAGASAVLTGSGSVTAQLYATASTGSYTVNNLSVGQVYYYTKGGSDTNITSGGTTLAASGFFTAATSSALLTGTASAPVTAAVQQIAALASGSFVAAASSVMLTGAASQPVTAVITGNVGWKDGSDQHCVVPLSHAQTASASFPVPAGGTASYTLQVSAIMSGGNQELLGYGSITAVDDGFASGPPSATDLVPSAAAYTAGSYTLTGLTNGKVYCWVEGANDTGCGSLTATGYFIASGTTQLLSGTGALPVTATVFLVNQ